MEKVKSNVFYISIKLIAFAVVAVMVLSTVMSFNGPVSAETTSDMTFTNASGDGGADRISMTDERTFEVVVTLETGTDAQALINSGLTWSLSRETGMFSYEDFPYQFLGGKMFDGTWTRYGSTEALFTLINEVAGSTVDGSPAIKMTFSNAYFFSDGTQIGRNRNNFLDYTGSFDLECLSGDTVLGTCQVRNNPYDSYHTNVEIAEKLASLTQYAEGRDDIYVAQYSLGQTTEGRDMPYIIVADSEKTLTEYQALKELAESDPAAVQAQLDAGTLDYKVPILYSNIHSDESNGADAVMDFAEALVTSDALEYNYLTGFKSTGETQLAYERAYKNVATSSLIANFENLSFLGAINEPTGSSDETSKAISLETYYNIEEYSLDVSSLLDDVFFILVPSENVDGRYYNVRNNANSFDLNRDNLFQTQDETVNMTTMIAQWNPTTFMELHGYVTGFQVEPCNAPHEPNFEYDLYAEMALYGGEAFGNAAVANNDTYNSYVMPMRDYLVDQNDGTVKWSTSHAWDDMSTNYTPQYAMLHGTVSYTIEAPYDDQDSCTALQYGLIGHAAFVQEYKETLYHNQLEVWKRGVNNEDADTIRQWYVNINDEKGAEADIFRPVSEENNNFFPEYYVIPLDADNQVNLAAAYEMQEYLVRNGVTVSTLTVNTEVNGVTYLAGSMVVNMYQAKRNVANGALYNGLVISGWSSLYSEPITAFSQTRGFDCDAIRVVGAFDGKLTELDGAEQGTTYFDGSPGNAVVITNDGIEAVKAVNDLLASGKQVGYITEGDNKGNFAVSYSDFASIKDNYILKTYGLSESPVTQELQQSKVYIAGQAALQTNGAVRYRQLYGNTYYGWIKYALETQMGFELVDNASEADVIMVDKVFTTDESDVVAAYKSGTPVIITRQASLVSKFVSGAEYSSNTSYDILTTVEYVGDSAVTDSFRREGDNIMYSMGTSYYTAIPDGANVLIKYSDDYPLEGFITETRIDAIKGQIGAWEYITDSVDLTVFANSLFSKAHQQDDYLYATNAIFSKNLGDAISIGTVDKSQLLATIETAEAIDSSLYSTASYISMQSVLTDAIAVYDSAAATQDEVDKANNDLIAAIKALLPIATSELWSQLQETIDKAKAIDLGKYTDKSASELSKVIAAAKEMLSAKDASDDEVKAMITAINNAIAALEETEVPSSSEDPSQASTSGESESSGDGSSAGSTAGGSAHTGDSPVIFIVALAALSVAVMTVQSKRKTR